METWREEFYATDYGRLYLMHARSTSSGNSKTTRKNFYSSHGVPDPDIPASSRRTETTNSHGPAVNSVTSRDDGSNGSAEDPNIEKVKKLYAYDRAKRRDTVNKVASTIVNGPKKIVGSVINTVSESHKNALNEDRKAKYNALKTSYVRLINNADIEIRRLEAELKRANIFKRPSIKAELDNVRQNRTKLVANLEGLEAKYKAGQDIP